MSDHTRPVEPSENTPAEQPVFGMKRAAEIAGISVSTIKRHKSRLEECGAVISPKGWKVPISALVASGLMKPTTPAPDYPEPEKGAQNATQGHSEVRELERQVMELKHRAELAEERQRSAEEKARAARELAEALSETLTVERRMLTGSAHPVSALASSTSHLPETLAEREEQHENGSSWWQRVFKPRRSSNG